MNNVNKTLYIPLYGKALVSSRGIILSDKTAEEIWAKEGFLLKGKSKSVWLAYYMAMRSAVYDAWLTSKIKNHPDGVVLHIGCGMDSRIKRISEKCSHWYDIDFPEVIKERKKYYVEDSYYQMIEADMRRGDWENKVKETGTALIIMEGVSMYFSPEEIDTLLQGIAKHFSSVMLLMDCYTEKAARISKYKNPINDVGVTTVYGYDEPEKLVENAGLKSLAEHTMTPKYLIDALQGAEKMIFRNIFAGKFAKNMYRMYEFSTI